MNRIDFDIGRQTAPRAEWRQTTDFHISNDYLAQPLSFLGIDLYQVGRLYCRTSTVVPTHAHINLFELTIITGGEGTVYTNGKPVPVKQGDIYLSFPCDLHKITSSANPLKYDFIAFNTKIEPYRTELETIVERFMPADKRIVSDEIIRYLVSNVINEFGNRREYAEELIAAALRQIIVYLIRDFKELTPHVKHTDNVSQQEMLCYQLMNYIDTHIYTLRRLEDITQFASYNYSYLSDLFKKTTQSTLSEYYHTRKLEVARLLIEERKLTISKISQLLNYSSVNAFSNAFKKKYGVSPKAYEKSLAGAGGS